MYSLHPRFERAGDGIRTHDNDVGNVVLYQLSYTRLHQAPGAATEPPRRLMASTVACLGKPEYRIIDLTQRLARAIGALPRPWVPNPP